MSDEKEQARQVLDEIYGALDEEARTFVKARIGIDDEAQLKEHILGVQLDAWTVSALLPWTCSISVYVHGLTHKSIGPQVPMHSELQFLEVRLLSLLLSTTSSLTCATWW